MNGPPPELDAFLRRIGDGVVFGQVWIQSAVDGFLLRHERDRARAIAELRDVPAQGLRALAQHNAAGQFRPLRSSPDLQPGWVHRASNPAALFDALQLLHPGALADWYAAQQTGPPVTSFADFASRQSGIYRSVGTLSAGLVERVTRACCDRTVCLKRRLWRAGELPTDAAESKSLIPCLEPCAILLELSRRAMKFDRETLLNVGVGGEELSTLRAALEAVRDRAEARGRQADFNDPLNPRRILWCLNRLPATPGAADAEESG